eukprot:385084-Hanusia_phi.AAC.2
MYNVIVALPRSLKTIATASVGLAGANLLLANKPREAFAHCQVPCGIFDDAAGLVQDLAALKDPQSMHWNQYVLAQRIKAPADTSSPKYESYIKLVVAVHQALQMAVTCKQKVDPQTATSLHKVNLLQPTSTLNQRVRHRLWRMCGRSTTIT